MLICGAHAYTPGRDLGVVSVRTDGGRIAEIGPSLARVAGEEVLPADGLTLLPGFVDVPYDPGAVVSNVAGSVALYPQCVRRFARVTGWPLEDVVKATGYNQLRSLGIADRGEIAVGQVADLVLVDGNLNPRATVVGGCTLFREGC